MSCVWELWNFPYCTLETTGAAIQSPRSINQQAAAQTLWCLLIEVFTVHSVYIHLIKSILRFRFSITNNKCITKTSECIENILSCGNSLWSSQIKYIYLTFKVRAAHQI